VPGLTRPRTVIAACAVLIVGLVSVGGALAARGRPSPPAEAVPPAAAFRPGACQAIAGPVRALAYLDRTLASAKTVPAGDRDRLTAEQHRLRAAQRSAERDLGRPLDDLITSIGYVRLRSDTHSYDRTVWATADDHRRVVQRVCVPPPAPRR
jgi:hypothetical protein